VKLDVKINLDTGHVTIDDREYRPVGFSNADEKRRLGRWLFDKLNKIAEETSKQQASVERLKQLEEMLAAVIRTLETRIGNL
jgi:hypothetical protein